MATKDYSDERKAMLAKTARLKELRLAKEAEDIRTAEPVTPKKATVRKIAVKRRNTNGPLI